MRLLVPSPNDWSNKLRDTSLVEKGENKNRNQKETNPIVITFEFEKGDDGKFPEIYSYQPAKASTW